MDNNKPKMQELTKVELEIMQIIWKLDGEFIIRDVHDNMPEPKPAYNTVSTMVRILDSKGFLTHKTYGHTNVYMAAVTKDEYTGRFMQGVLNSFFGGSVSRLVTFFSDNKNLSVKEADEIINMLNKK
ncbi:MAG: BlaI/MecI/CopY family transcriptional regulator [Bacteroidaceae bacterium]|jgi:predicted transcriptional regulator|nr:BlaI/MecI/CopY family transcriptional regulator [Bacteroidaceae bacterium]MBP5692031.1 BlaI/MecI/CopY family transcriptional regulator [Bacteroidaceae bacterium]